VDYKEVLNEADFAVFSRLRDLRKVIAEKEAVPAYAIFTNEQLAAMVTGKVDRLCQAEPGVHAYARYMDDFVCWADDKAALLELGGRIGKTVVEELGLTLKHPPAPQPCSRGMDFLGYRIFPTHTRLNRRSKVRYQRRLRAILPRVECGEIPELAAQQRLTALTAFLLPAKSWAYRARVLGGFRSAAIGLEPGEPGRQLEQQREQLPHREPQQQQPRQQQQQQQPGVPLRPQLRPSAPDGAGESQTTGLNRPPSRSSPQPRGGDKTQKRPPGVSSSAEAGSNAPGGPIFMEDYSSSKRTDLFGIGLAPIQIMTGGCDTNHARLRTGKRPGQSEEQKGLSELRRRAAGNTGRSILEFSVSLRLRPGPADDWP
jgi:hypothetical protein